MHDRVQNSPFDLHQIIYQKVNDLCKKHLHRSTHGEYKCLMKSTGQHTRVFVFFVLGLSLHVAQGTIFLPYISISVENNNVGHCRARAGLERGVYTIEYAGAGACKGRMLDIVVPFLSLYDDSESSFYFNTL